jgi:hypothetical protein
MKIVDFKGDKGNFGSGARPLAGHHQKALKVVTKNVPGPNLPLKTIDLRAQTSDRYRS